MLSASAIVSNNGIQQALAITKNCTGVGTSCWCYSTSNSEACAANKGDCVKGQRSNPDAKSGCFKEVF